MIEKHIVLNYDLGLRGDYTNLFAFLDDMKAVDCGNCNAAFAMNFSQDLFDIIYDELSHIISGRVNLETTDRIYMIVTDATGSMKGRFISGSRRRPLWEGYGAHAPNHTDEF